MSSTTNQSTILFPGSFSLPEFYDPLLEKIRAKGISINAIHPPTVGEASNKGREGSLPTMYDDAAFLAAEVEKLADQGKDVIVVAHSYGGVPTTQAMHGLSKDEREKAGKKGGVVRVGYMTAVIPGLGKSAADVLADVPAESKLELKIDDQGWMYHDPAPASAAIAFSQQTPEYGTTLVEKFARHSSVSFTNEITHAGYCDVPVSFLFCEEDKCIVPDIQQAEIEMIERESGRKVDVTRIPADHCPNLSREEDVVSWIVGLGGKSGD